MNEDPATSSCFTNDQVQTLQEFADNIAVGRRAFQVLAWFFGFVGAMTAFLYYFSSILQHWGGQAASK